MNNPLTIFITGGAGYVGAMLADQFHDRPEVKELILLDKEPMPELLKGKPKITYIQQNMSENGWQETVKDKNPDVVIHTAWEIREIYGAKEKHWRWNVGGSDKVFDLAFSIPSVKKLLHFSSVASYGAFKENDINHRFTEAEPFKKTDYSYAEQKREAEEHLEEKYKEAKTAGHAPQVFVVRPAAITGPRGRFMRVRFGLQSSLSGQLKTSPSFFHRLVSLMVAFVPATREWCRQFVHEDDLNDIVEKLTFGEAAGEFEIFNLCPPGNIVRARDMARAVNKRLFPVSPQMIRWAYFLAWHVSLGKIPTARGSWKFYSYPVAVDGSKITRELGYQYKFNSLDAFTKLEGRYAKYVK